MKCPKCGGTGVFVTNAVEPQNNEEWLRSATTEQLVEFLFRMAYMCSYCGDEAHSSQEKIQQCHFGKCGCQRKDWVVWLKQPHTDKE